MTKDDGLPLHRYWIGLLALVFISSTISVHLKLDGTEWWTWTLGWPTVWWAMYSPARRL